MSDGPLDGLPSLFGCFALLAIPGAVALIYVAVKIALWLIHHVRFA